MIGSRGISWWNLPCYSKFVINLVLGVVALCYLVYSDYRLEYCLPAIRFYSWSVIISEIFHKLFLPHRSATEGGYHHNVSSAGGKGKTKNKSSKVSDVFVVFLLSLCSVCCIHIVTVLYGAYLIENVEETLTFSILVAALALIRPLIFLGPKAFQILLDRLNWEEEPDLQCIAVFLGAWLGALPIPLDWDSPWQVWPLTCCIGAIFGELASSLYLFINISSKKKNKAT